MAEGVQTDESGLVMKLKKWLLGSAGVALLGVVSTQVQAQLAPGLTPGNASLNDAPPISAPNWGGAHWHGDVGLAEYAMPNWVSASNSAKKSTVLPYLFGQTEVFFARVDTFGIKTLPIGCCLLYTSPSPRDGLLSRMPSSA